VLLQSGKEGMGVIFAAAVVRFRQLGAGGLLVN
jgi:hypothetical protein